MPSDRPYGSGGGSGRPYDGSANNGNYGSSYGGSSRGGSNYGSSGSSGSTYGSARPAQSGGGVYGGSSGSTYGSGSSRTRGSSSSGTKGTSGGSKNKKNGGKKPTSPLWTKLAIAFGALFMVGSIGAFATLQAGLNEINHAIPTGNLFAGAGAAEVSGKSINGALNILLVGVDASGVRTDSIIIVHIPASHDRAYLVSLPRDTRVNMPGGGTGKINAAFNKGFANLATTINNNYGIKFNAGATLNFDGFADIVRRVGGVDMYVDETTHSIHHGYRNGNKADHAEPYNIDPNSGVPICSNPNYTFDTNPDKCTRPGITEVTYPKGMYHFNAYDALDFVRCRDGLVGTDYARQRHQQQFIKALMKKAYSQGMSNPTKLIGFVQALGKAFTFQSGAAISDWLFTLKGIDPNNVITIKTNGGQFVTWTGAPDGSGSEQTLNPDSVQLLQDVRDDNGSADLVGTFVSQHPDWLGG